MFKKTVLLALTIFLLAVSSAGAAYTDNDDGTVTDTATGLMWQKCSMGQTWNEATNGCDGTAFTYSWRNALLQSENLTLAGHSDWRLPNRNELQSLVDYSRYYPAINTTYFPGTVSSYYWSSSTIAGSTNSAWLVYFGHGSVNDDGSKSYSYYVRAVRAGQSSGSLGDLVISQTPMSGPPGTSFTQRGMGFTPNGTATLHFRNPLGDELDPIQLDTNALGAFEIVYNSLQDKPAGTHFWWAVDNATGERSGTLGYEITSGGIEKTSVQEGLISATPPQAVDDYSFGKLERVGGFDSAKDTFVIVHGWNLTGVSDLPSWVIEMANAIHDINGNNGSLASGSNVYTWNWQKEAKSTGTYWPVEDAGNSCIEVPEVPFQNTDPSGKFLALALKKALPPDYSGSIHMIGHSLGSLVITHAAKFAYDNPDYFPFKDRINHLVLLDSPCLYGRPADDFLEKKKDDIFVDNYWSFFGKTTGYSEADTNVYLPNWVNYGHVDGHAYSHEWYRSSVTNFSDPSILHDLFVPSSPQHWGFFWWDPDNHSQAWSSYLQPAGTLLPQWLLTSVPLKEGSGLVVDVAVYTGGMAIETWDWVVDFSQRAKKKVKIVAANTYNSTMDVGGYVTDAAGHAFLWMAYPGSAAGLLRLEHHSDATVSTTMDIPANVNAMTLGYRFAYAQPGTVFEVFIDDLPVFHAFSHDAIAEGYRMVPWIDISPFAGKSVNLTIRVSHPTLDAEGAVEIDDLMLARIESDILGDMDGDDDVDGKDIKLFAAEYGRTDCNGDCEGDYVVDSAINENDLVIFTGNFGRSQ